MYCSVDKMKHRNGVIKMQREIGNFVRSLVMKNDVPVHHRESAFRLALRMHHNSPDTYFDAEARCLIGNCVVPESTFEEMQDIRAKRMVPNIQIACIKLIRYNGTAPDGCEVGLKDAKENYEIWEKSGCPKSEVV
jgi:hypothetical protein